MKEKLFDTVFVVSHPRLALKTGLCQLKARVSMKEMCPLGLIIEDFPYLKLPEAMRQSQGPARRQASLIRLAFSGVPKEEWPRPEKPKLGDFPKQHPNI